MTATTTTIKHGNFDSLAGDYAQYRPGYSPSIVTAVLSLVGRPAAEVDAADVGAGTGIWTRMLASRGLRSVTAVEPSDEMRRQGELTSKDHKIVWRKGKAEETGLPSGAYDLVSMASSFHWTDFDRACAEFQRMLRPGGRFVALWNPRMVELNPMLHEIEQEITRLNPGVKRVSSGRSGLTEKLTDMLWAKAGFDDVVYLEGRHVGVQTPAQYLGAWRSVNDLRVQLGPDLFDKFLEFVERKTAGVARIETTYLTRAWAARRT
ncbi:MAG: class I SAM-dependent methyltransferase [Bryobacteraceae bacterium]